MATQPITPPGQPPRKVVRGKAIEWTDGDLDRLSEIHVAEDTALMLAFVRRYGGPRLYALMTAKRPPDEASGENA